MSKKMYCKLKCYVVTQDDKFIPEGTLVEVVQWDKGSQIILVKALAYLVRNPDGTTTVGENTELEININMLQYDSAR